MQGAGNDFVVLDCTQQPFALNSAQLKQLADRHLGVGCDQILVVEKAKNAQADFGYRIFNADGGEVEQCGNGARCFVKFVHARGLTDKREIAVETLGGLIRPRLEPDGEVSVDMGHAVDAGARAAERRGPQHRDHHPLHGQSARRAGGARRRQRAGAHAGAARSRPIRAFPNRVNAGYMQVLERHAIALRVWERGAGETLSCGSGACAAVVAGIWRKLLDTPVKVETRGGTLTVAWAGGENAVL